MITGRLKDSYYITIPRKSKEFSFPKTNLYNLNKTDECFSLGVLIESVEIH